MRVDLVTIVVEDYEAAVRFFISTTSTLPMNG